MKSKTLFINVIDTELISLNEWIPASNQSHSTESLHQDLVFYIFSVLLLYLFYGLFPKESKELE